jgi:hypothetical protein
MSDELIAPERMAELMRQRQTARDALFGVVDALRIVIRLETPAVIMGLGDVMSDVIGHAYGESEEQGRLLNQALDKFIDTVRGQAQWHRRRECQQQPDAQDAVIAREARGVH